MGRFELKSFTLLFVLILAGCQDPVVEETDFKFPEEESIAFTEQKRVLSKEWYEKMDITITKEVPIIEFIKGAAKKLGIKLMFNVKETTGMNYCAKDKPFIEILSDVCDELGWKLQIKEKNGKLSPDSVYMHTYSVPFLVGERKGSSDSSFAGKSNNKSSGSEGMSGVNIGSSGGLSSEVTLNPFEELRKNLEMIASSQKQGKEGDQEGQEQNQVKFSMHQQAGALNVIATQKVHKMIAKYINILSKQIRDQILIEAKIYEVELYERFETGVDWGRLLSLGAQQNGLPIAGSANSETGALNVNIINSSNMNKVEGNILSLLRIFGKVHSMSNPRVMIANNNIAIFKVVDNKVFFRLTQQQHVSSDGNNRNNQNSNNNTWVKISSEIHTVPVGVILLVQPSIDAHGRITISMQPTISEVHGEVEDPAIAIMANNAKIADKVSSKIPIIKTRELNTVFTTEENKVVIVGGLLYEKKRENESGLPLSWASGKKERLSEKKEIVIAIKAKIAYCQANYYDLIFLE